MKSRLQHNATPLITTIHKLFSVDLARENDFLRQENKILRSKLGKRVPLTDHDRRTLIRYGLPIRERLADVISIVRPETLLAWHRRMKRLKWTFDTTPKRPGRPPKRTRGAMSASPGNYASSGMTSLPPAFATCYASTDCHRARVEKVCRGSSSSKPTWM